jgi:CRP-like cAMP-binding protein
MPFVPLPGGLRERALAKLLPQNGLLAVLPVDVRERLLPHLALADLPAGQQLGQADGSFARAYFPVQGLVSLVQPTIDGGERIAALVGHEGAVGLPRFMRDADVKRVLVQAGGYALVLGREPLLEEWGRGGAFMRVLLRYRDAVAAQRAVLGACRAQHPLDQQLASLLAMCADRAPTQDIVLSQQSAAQLLGVGPQAIGAAVERLRAAGAASWRRPGLFTSADDAALRAYACRCGSRLAAEYEHLLPVDDEAALTIPALAAADGLLGRPGGPVPR